MREFRVLAEGASLSAARDMPVLVLAPERLLEVIERKRHIGVRSQVLAYILAQPGRVTMPEIAQALDLPLSSVGNATHYLANTEEISFTSGIFNLASLFFRETRAIDMTSAAVPWTG